MFEHRSEPMAPWGRFLRRLARHGGYAAALVGVSMVGGTVGFHALAGQEWIDAWLNAAMLLGGMGPVGDIQSTAGKLFASLFALYAGLVFIAAGGIILAPALHRMIHRLHAEQK